MISADAQLLRQRADCWQQRLGQGEVLSAQSTVGGGSLPEEMLPTFVLALQLPHIEQAAARLRKGSTPVIARVQDGKLLLDPRTVLLEEEDQLIEQLNLILAGDRE